MKCEAWPDECSVLCRLQHCLSVHSFIVSCLQEHNENLRGRDQVSNCIWGNVASYVMEVQDFRRVSEQLSAIVIRCAMRITFIVAFPWSLHRQVPFGYASIFVFEAFLESGLLSSGHSAVFVGYCSRIPIYFAYFQVTTMGICGLHVEVSWGWKRISFPDKCPPLSCYSTEN